MPEIVLTTLNARYIHAAFGLRYLMANLGPLQSSACIAEFDINQRPIDIAEMLLAREPKIIGLGVYIWNVTETTELVGMIKRVKPETIVILGGPEVSYEAIGQPVVELADYVITGEADLKFAEVCGQLLSGKRPETKIMAAELPNFQQLVLPYDFYTEQDIAHRVIYVEASRGCPFSCEFCLSSLDIPVRQAPLDRLLEHLERLLERGVKQFKFVDRTFNLNLATSQALLEFCLERWRPGLFFHFEMIPDRLPQGLRDIIARFPAGALQFEVGIQSFNEEVCQRISRRQNFQRLEDNLQFLRRETGVHLHTDLIFGLPGETLESFGAGFDRLIGLGPQEIQVGILKRLRGTPIGRHDAEWQMVYNAGPPYEILRNRLVDFPTLQRMRRFARYWDLVGNSGNFGETTRLLWRGVELMDGGLQGVQSGRLKPGLQTSQADRLKPGIRAGAGSGSPFWCFMEWSEWLYAQVGRTDSIALGRLAELLFLYLTKELGLAPSPVAQALWADYQRAGRREQPEFLRPFVVADAAQSRRWNRSGLLKRQSRHLAGAE